jgi:hypothetical protein
MTWAAWGKWNIDATRPRDRARSGGRILTHELLREAVRGVYRALGQEWLDHAGGGRKRQACARLSQGRPAAHH